MLEILRKNNLEVVAIVFGILWTAKFYLDYKVQLLQKEKVEEELKILRADEF